MADKTQSTDQQAKAKRSEKDGALNFGKEMASALAMAFVAIVYAIQAFTIPTGSMEQSLHIGDFLLGLKFWYGAPVLPFDITYTKFPAAASPKPGEVIIFKYPGKDPGSEGKDFIKRCVAGPGQVVEVHGKTLTVDNKVFKLPPKGQFIYNAEIGPWTADYPALRIPKKGDLIKIADLPIREFVFAKTLIHQEHPDKNISILYDLYVDSTLSSNIQMIKLGNDNYYSFRQLTDEYNRYSDWTKTAEVFKYVNDFLSGHRVQIVKKILVDGKPITDYKVEQDCYFMMGDNRDNSLDGRYWGYVDRNFIKAKAFILYFSLDPDVPWYELPLKIRWDRIGKLIRNWDGTKADPVH